MLASQLAAVFCLLLAFTLAAPANPMEGYIFIARNQHGLSEIVWKDGKPYFDAHGERMRVPRAFLEPNSLLFERPPDNSIRVSYWW